jgi:aspartyl protease family protein
MSFPFNPNDDLIRVDAVVEGLGGPADVVLPLDTAAVDSVISDAYLVAIGYDPTQAPEQVQAIAATGMVSVPRLPVMRLSALGQDRVDFPVLAHTLPPSAVVDGLLGLDFLRGKTLKIDFQAGLIDLL